MRGKLITVFGGSGFIGRSVVKRLAEAGANVRVVCRDPALAGDLRPLGDVGQIVLERLSNHDDETLSALCEGSTAVVNLIGILYESRADDFERIHAELAGTIAEAGAKVGASHCVQMSAIGADTQSESAYARSKAGGEANVLEAFPSAVILRPSIVFGPGDGFFARFGDMAARAPFLPLIDGGKTRFQPVYVGDVADAVLAGLDGTAESGVYELGGPKVYTFKQLLQYLLEVLDRKNFLLPLTSKMLQFPAKLAEMLPVPPITRDQLTLLKYDNVVDAGARGLSDLGIEAAPLETIVPFYVRAYAAQTASVVSRA